MTVGDVKRDCPKGVSVVENPASVLRTGKRGKAAPDLLTVWPAGECKTAPNGSREALIQ